KCSLMAVSLLWSWPCCHCGVLTWRSHTCWNTPLKKKNGKMHTNKHMIIAHMFLAIQVSSEGIVPLSVEGTWST
ncbi:hypothetical protein F5148DRAFT_1201387, partial [Russula earlei]